MPVKIAHNPKVAGSSPAPATKKKLHHKRWSFFILKNFIRIQLDEKFMLSVVEVSPVLVIMDQVIKLWDFKIKQK